MILATHIDDTLRVFVRDEHGGLDQVAQLRAVVDAPELLTIVSDLDLHLGWSVNGVAAERPLPRLDGTALVPVLPASRGNGPAKTVVASSSSWQRATSR